MFLLPSRHGRGAGTYSCYSVYEHSGGTRVVVTFITQGLESFQGYQTAHSCPCKQSPLRCPMSFKFFQPELTWICYDFPSKTIKCPFFVARLHLSCLQMVAKFLSRSSYIDANVSVQFLRTIYMIYGIFASQEEGTILTSCQISHQCSSPSGQPP